MMRWLCTFLLLVVGYAEAIEWNILTGPRRVALGPEAYHVERSRANGSCQSGWLYGVRGLLERSRDNSLYWGVEGFWTTGDLDGHLKNKNRIHSCLDEGEIEGRLGFQGAFCCRRSITFTPFFGGGYYWGRNRFRSPSPIHVIFHDRYGFWSLGFLSSVAISDRWSGGIRFWARRMVEGCTRTSDDPEMDRSTLIMNNTWHYRIDIPIMYAFCLCEREFSVDLIPFYEYRELGGRVNFPFDFIETRLNIWGIRLLFSHIF